MSTINLTFENNSGFDATDIYVGFVGGSGGTAFSVTNTATGAALALVDGGVSSFPATGNWYTLDSLSSGATVTSFSGRVYVCYGSPWAVQYTGYEPGQAVTDPNFFLRYDKMEMTFTGAPADVANLTSIDYWAVPMSLETFKAGKSVQTVSGLVGKTTAQDVFDKLNKLTTPPVSGVAGPGGTDGSPLPALVPGAFTQYPGGPAPGTAFARIIGPSSYPSVYPNVGIPVMPYDTLEEYLKWLRHNYGKATKRGVVVKTLGKGVAGYIVGEFAGVGPNVPASGPQSRQSYNYAAFIEDNLDICLRELEIDLVEGADVNEGGNTILFKRDDLLNPSGIYGGNTPFYLNGASTPTAPANDVYGWIGGDLFSGMNIGALGSQAKVDGKVVGAMHSQDWFKLPVSGFYGGLQKGTKNYNQWSAALAELSDAYNFAYSDRFAHVFASLDAQRIDTLTLKLEDAAVQMP